MKVKELKKELKTFDDDEDVVIEDESENEYEIERIYWDEGDARIKIKNT